MNKQGFCIPQQQQQQHEDHTDFQSKQIHKQQQKSPITTPNPEVNNKNRIGKWNEINSSKLLRKDNNKILWSDIIGQLSKSLLVIEDWHQISPFNIEIISNSQLKLTTINQYWKKWFQHRRAFIPDFLDFSRYQQLIGRLLTTQ